MVSTTLSESVAASETGASQASPPVVSGIILVFAAHSPVNILIVTPSGQKAGFEADGTQANEVGANLTGPGTEPETVAIPNPTIGTYDILVFGKSSAGAGSPYTITAGATGANSTGAGSWSYSGTAESGSQSSLLVNLSPGGTVSSASGGGGLPATEFFAVLGAVTLVEALIAVGLVRRQGRVMKSP